MKIYCSGIGGIGLSAYASLQRMAGHTVLGSDRANSALLDDLRSQGITVILNQSGSSVPPDANLFVYSEAIPVDAPERVKATELGIRQQSYPEALGDLSRGCENVIAVCGTHGKSSTTGMAARLLTEAGLDPTIVVGTKLKELNGRNWRQGKPGGIFLLEACEYRNSFHHYNPSVILLTNCDGDHFDFYRSMEDYHASFVTFVAKLPAHGTLITHLGDPHCRAVSGAAGRTTLDADTSPMIALKTPGEHMRKNAQLVLSLANALGIPKATAEQAVSGYAGSWRRMELKGAFRSIPVIDDYGHHPTEIHATLTALREAYPTHRIVCVFQPHTHDRTIKLYDDFVACFRGIDTVIIPGIYDARADIETERVDLPRFLKDIEVGSGVTCLDGKSLKETEAMLKAPANVSPLRSGDLLVCMGAGDITNLAARMIETNA